MRAPRLSPLISSALLALFAAACQDASSDKVLGNGTLKAIQEEGVNISANPALIILDPNDPTAPRDGSNKLTGKSAISAIVLDAALQPVAGVEVTFSTSAGTLFSTGLPVTTDQDGLALDTLYVTEDQIGEVTVTGSSGASSRSVVVAVDFPPVANAGEDQTLTCGGDGGGGGPGLTLASGSTITLDGSGSTDSNSTTGTNDDIASFEWFIGDSLIATGEVVEVSLPPGTNTITLKVTDKAGATSTDEVTVTVTDTEAPVVTLTMSPDHLWPPNHKMVEVHAVLDIQDCDPATSVELVSVTSNEPENGLGDGNTAPDIAGADLGTDDRDVEVRSERAGPGSGRVYTFVYRVTDSSGNSTEATATVTVPHDQGH
jgi:hypothetical protein